MSGNGEQKLLTVFLTGGSGFLGSHIAEQLSQVGHRVRALVRRSSNTSFLRTLPNVELYYGAIDDAAGLREAVKGVDAIIHAAGLVKARSPQEFHRVNAGGTVNLLEAARTTRDSLRRFVLISSLAVTGPSEDGSPVSESAPPNPVTHYGRSKLAAERAALGLKDELPLTILRPPLLYGPRDREVIAFFKAVKTGVLPYVGSTNNTCSVVYGADAARACILAIDKDVPSGSIYFLDDGRVLTIAELVGHIERALRMRAKIRVPIPRGVLKTAAIASELYGKARGKAVMLTRDKCNELWASHWVCNGQQAVEDLGWQPEVQFDRGAELTARWYLDNGWL